MAPPFVLFCKSWRIDVLRVRKLLDSLVAFNRDRLPFFLSIPKNERALFDHYIDFSAIRSQANFSIEILTDEDIALSIPNTQLDDYYKMRGYLHQQVIKAQAWRYLDVPQYLSLDSDSFFTEPFYLSYFMHADGAPFSLLHEAEDLLQDAMLLNKRQVILDFQRESQRMKELFGRFGPDYDFGPPPMIWSAAVWKDLDQQFLQPRNMRIWEAIATYPAEIRWYGEALLKFQSISIHPTKPLFKFYHYAWQRRAEKIRARQGQSGPNYIGTVLQSNWDKDMDPPFCRKSWISRRWRSFKETYL